MFTRQKNKTFLQSLQSGSLDPYEFMRVVQKSPLRGYHRLNYSIINGWSDFLKKAFTTWIEDAQNKVYFELSTLYLACYETETLGIKNLLALIDPSLTIHKRLFVMPSVGDIALMALRTKDLSGQISTLGHIITETPNHDFPKTLYFHYLSLRYEKLKQEEKDACRWGAAKLDIDLITPYIKLVEEFIETSGEKLPEIIMNDVRVASKMSEIYFEEYQKRAQLPEDRKDDLLQEAKRWAIFAGNSVRREPVASNIYAQILKIEKADPIRYERYLQAAAKHFAPS